MLMMEEPCCSCCLKDPTLDTAGLILLDRGRGADDDAPPALVEGLAEEVGRLAWGVGAGEDQERQADADADLRHHEQQLRQYR